VNGLNNLLKVKIGYIILDFSKQEKKYLWLLKKSIEYIFKSFAGVYRLFLYLIYNFFKKFRNQSSKNHMEEFKRNQKLNYSDYYFTANSINQIDNIIQKINLDSTIFIYLTEFDLSINNPTGIHKSIKAIVMSLKKYGLNLVFVTNDYKSGEAFNLKIVEDPFPMGEKNNSKQKEVTSDVFDNLFGQTILVLGIPYLGTDSIFITTVLRTIIKKYRMNSYAIIYDNIPIDIPEYSSKSNQHLEYLQLLSEMTHLFAISNKTKLSFKSSFEILEKQIPKIETIRLPLLKEARSSEVGIKVKSISNLNYYLLVGSFESRKNWNVVFEMIRKYRGSNYFILVGNADESHLRQIENFEFESKLKYVGYVNETELDLLYQNCETIIYPSNNEGLGLPIFEAFEKGKMPIIAMTSVNLEFWSEKGVILVDNYLNSDGWLKSLLEYEQLSKNKNEEIAQNLSSHTDPKLEEDFTKNLLHLINQNALSVNKNINCLYFVDYIRFYDGNSGIQKVIRSLGKALLELGVCITPIGYDQSEETFIKLSESELINLSNFDGPEVNKWYLPTNLNLELYNICIIPELTTYSSQNNFLSDVLKKLSTFKIKTIAIAYDLLPVKMSPEIYSLEAAHKHESYVLDLLESDHISCISEITFKDMLNLYAKSGRHVIKGQKISVNTLPVLNSSGQENSMDKDSIGHKVVYVATFEQRKNHKRLINAFKKFHRKFPNYELILVGKESDPELFKSVLKLSEEFEWLKIRRNLNQQALNDLYLEAKFAVYVSLGEGFGLPIAEAFSYGLPILSGFEEDIGSLARLPNVSSIDVRNEQEIYEGLVRMAGEIEFEEKYFDNVITKNWINYARQLLINIIQ
jgi:glycosyltransferase involved in cell wall biosynthesis